MKTTTTNLLDFEYNELEAMGDLLHAMKEQGLPKDFNNDEVHPMMNQSSRDVFLTNSYNQIAMMNGDKLESLYTLSSDGTNWFIDDLWTIYKDGCIKAKDYKKLADILEINGMNEEAETVRTKIKQISNLGYRNRLKSISRGLKTLKEFKENYSPDTLVYVYLSLFPKDKILTGEYYQNCGIYEEGISPAESTINYGREEQLTVRYMTLQEFEKFMLSKKEEQDKLDDKYPYLINGGKYGNINFYYEIDDESYLDKLSNSTN